jgi:hypothetical protein
VWLSTAWSTRVKVVVTAIATLFAVLPVVLIFGMGSL